MAAIENNGETFRADSMTFSLQRYYASKSNPPRLRSRVQAQSLEGDYTVAAAVMPRGETRTNRRSRSNARSK